jgi:hypothetical protein
MNFYFNASDYGIVPSLKRNLVNRVPRLEASLSGVLAVLLLFSLFQFVFVSARETHPL